MHVHCAVPRMDGQLGVLSASISRWTLNIPLCPSQWVGEIWPAPWINSKFLLHNLGGTVSAAQLHLQPMMLLAAMRCLRKKEEETFIIHWKQIHHNPWLLLLKQVIFHHISSYPTVKAHINIEDLLHLADDTYPPLNEYRMSWRITEEIKRKL